jgi:hypothetical protein
MIAFFLHFLTLATDNIDQFVTNLLFTEFSVISMHSETWYKINNHESLTCSPCRGGIQYLHRDPASRRRRRKGKSQCWDRYIWARVPKASDQRKIALARASSIYKRQTRPLVREVAPQEQDRNCHTGNQDLVVSPKWVLYSKTDWPADRRNIKLNSAHWHVNLEIRLLSLA